MTPEELYTAAATAAVQAANACTPTPMGLYDADPLTGARRGPVQVVSEGPCGFAYVIIKPARGAFVKYLKDQKLGHKGYYGGYKVSMSHLSSSQSYERAVAAARAFAKVLQDNGVKCYTDSRLD